MNKSYFTLQELHPLRNVEPFKYLYKALRNAMFGGETTVVLATKLDTYVIDMLKATGHIQYDITDLISISEHIENTAVKITIHNVEYYLL